jgi:hypothetical protein
MKKSLISTLSLALLLPFSSSALAHTGHLPNESVHGFLHVEHIIMLAAAGLVVYLIKVLGNK